MKLPYGEETFRDGLVLRGPERASSAKPAWRGAHLPPGTSIRSGEDIAVVSLVLPCLSLLCLLRVSYEWEGQDAS